MEFLCLFLRHHWVGKPVVAPANVNCFLRLTQILHATDYLLIIYKYMCLDLFLQLDPLCSILVNNLLLEVTNRPVFAFWVVTYRWFNCIK